MIATLILIMTDIIPHAGSGLAWGGYGRWYRTADLDCGGLLTGEGNATIAASSPYTGRATIAAS